MKINWSKFISRKFFLTLLNNIVAVLVLFSVDSNTVKIVSGAGMAVINTLFITVQGAIDHKATGTADTVNG